MKIGRNAPCPCGSGKKYKRCCGSAISKKSHLAKDFAYFELARRLAYVGKIGKRRKEFCETFLKIKRRQLEEVKISQEHKAASSNELIQCHKGCCFCCVQFIGGSLQECEGIVYYLYQDKDAFSLFLNQYPKWRKKIKENNELFKRLGILYNQMCSSGFDDHFVQLFQDATGVYFKQNIPCPFLHNGECLIYPVRPGVCASVISTTKPEWCSPLNENRPKIYVIGHTQIDLPYYYGSKSALIMSSVPLMVYEILKNGFIYLAKIPHLQDIDKEALTDPEAQGILKSSDYLIENLQK